MDGSWANGPSYFLINLGAPSLLLKLKKEDLLYGGAGLLGGYLIGTSFDGISHHASCGDCAHLSCSEVLSAACIQKCNQNGGLNAALAKCKSQNPPVSKIGTTAPGNQFTQQQGTDNSSCAFLDLACYQQHPGLSATLCPPGLPDIICANFNWILLGGAGLVAYMVLKKL